jgi:putative acetyltransferase
MKLRAARRADIPALAEIAAASYRTAFAEILEPAALAERDAAFFQAHFCDGLDRLGVAVADGRIVGFAQITGGHLDMLFVLPECQGTGAGAALLRQAEAGGVRTLECFRDNHPARAFYESQGWRLTRAYERDFVGRRRAFVFYEKP